MTFLVMDERYNSDPDSAAVLLATEDEDEAKEFALGCNGVVVSD